MSAVSVSEEWRQQAMRDFDVAKHLAAEGYYEWAAYAAQQAAEKAIKAVRHVLAIDTHDKPRKEFTHDLIALSGPLRELWPSLLPGPDRLGTINSHESDGRYPGLRSTLYRAPMTVYDAPTAYSALLIAEMIVTKCVSLVSELQAFWSQRPP